MPRWNIKHTPRLFSDEEKEATSKKITEIYVQVGLPAFYVQVIFEELPHKALFVGGKEHTKFASIEVLHIARNFQHATQKKAFLNMVDSILNPLFEKKGIDWEYFVGESDRDLWKINGIYPPESGSALEKKWIDTNRPSKL
ncbi:hypothetical protein LSUE1_G002908 [Lachnellula suecica]|uniref:Tautomerase cis-CaaD-like domain-containing protein n=1 Tax=Lachnellula suecica TaxID=602035 RepID=A0A8T9CE98_9HELO|nr:hypothetical protein LSUE1_G002908 [Lachnellula suecica]